MMDSEKYVLLLVEGRDEIILLDSIIKQINKEFNIITSPIKIALQSDSILTDARGNTSNAKDIIHNGIKKSDIDLRQIMQVYKISDVDGCWIFDEDHEIDPEEKNHFSFDSIQKKIFFDTVKRNNQLSQGWARKRKRLINMFGEKQTVTIDRYKFSYKIYLNNVALEHVIADNIVRSSAYQKKKYALDVKNDLEKAMDELGSDAALQFFKSKINNCATNTELNISIQENPWLSVSGIYFLLLDIINVIENYASQIQNSEKIDEEKS